MSATPSPATAMAMGVGPKDITPMGTMDTVTLNKAYLVLSSTTIVTDCSGPPLYTAALDGLLDIIIPRANAHTVPTPTSTGIPYVIDILGMDDAPISIGGMSPSVANYCGVDIDMLAADADAQNLPAGTNMIGKTLYVEGTYTLAGGGGGNILIDTGVTLVPRNLRLSALMMISAGSPSGSVALAINYDTWFDTVDLALFEGGDAGELNKVLLNVTGSIHQL
jgi:hypothetical protein